MALYEDEWDPFARGVAALIRCPDPRDQFRTKSATMLDQSGREN